MLVQKVKQAYRFVDDPLFHLCAAVLDRWYDCYRFARIGLAVFHRYWTRRSYVVQTRREALEADDRMIEVGMQFAIPNHQHRHLAIS